MNAVSIKGLKKVYHEAENEIVVLNNINLEIASGEFLAIIGASGSGKTTLLNMIGGLDTPTNGIVTINDVTINNLSDDDMAVFRRENIGFVFQQYNLITSLTVYENIVLPLRLDGREIDEDYLYELINSLEIKGLMRKMPLNLSGGEQQRIAIARALITKPAIILADEPTGNLDSVGSKKVIELIEELSRRYKQTIALVTHNEKIALRANRIIRIEDGKLFDK